ERLEGGLQRLPDLLEQHLRDLHLDRGEDALVFGRRLGSVAPEEQFDHRENEVAVEADDDPAVPPRHVEDRGDRVHLIAVEHVADALAVDLVERDVRRRPREVPQPASSSRRSTGAAVPGLGLCTFIAYAACFCGTAPAFGVFEIASLSTSSIVGRSLAEIALRPCSSAICGRAPFMKAMRLCLTMKYGCTCFSRVDLMSWASGETTA